MATIFQITKRIMLVSAIITIVFSGFTVINLYNHGLISGLNRNEGIAAMFVIFIVGTSFTIYGWKGLIACAER